MDQIWSKPMMMALISLIPSIGICIFVYFKDKKEKEPLWLLGLLFAVSAAAYIPLYYLGDVINGLFIKIFGSDFKSIAGGGYAWTDTKSMYLHNGLCALIGIALVEELARWLILYFFTNKSKYFNCTFDGVVYSVVVSMGAVLARNLRIAFASGWDQFVLRFAQSFPWYLLFGIVMGVFYTLWHTKRHANRTENRLIDEGKLKKNKIGYPVFTLILSILVPVLLHAAYSFVFDLKRNSASGFGLNADRSEKLNFIFYIIAAVMMIVCIVLIIVLSKRDRSEIDAVEEIIEEEHGDLPDEYYEEEETEEDSAEDDKEEDK